MEYTPYSLLIDVGWISALMLVGNLLRRKVSFFQSLLIPSPITAGLLGLVLGPQVLGWIGFSDQIGTYTTVLIAVVFAAMPYSMEFDRSVRAGARTMWSYSTGMFLGQWGIFILLGVLVFTPVWGTEPWFGMMLPVGFVGGFGTAAAVGGALESGGAEVASSLGFTSATVGTFAAIIGGVIFTQWAIRKGKTSEIPEKLPFEMRSGYIDKLDERPSIGRATTNPSALESLSLHAGAIAITVGIAYGINSLISSQFESVSIPLFATAFVVGVIGRLILQGIGAGNYLDRDTMNSASGAATDYLIAFGIASIVPAAVADYWVPLLILFALGLVYCLVFFWVVAPAYFGKQWFERGIFGWGWATAAVSTALALLKMVDPRLKSGTLNEYGVAYIAYAPFEIAVTILAPIAMITGWVMGLGVLTLVLAIVALAAPWVFRWMPHQMKNRTTS